MKRTIFGAQAEADAQIGRIVKRETAITHGDGHTSVNKTPKVTGKGQQYFINLFLKGA